MVQKVLCGIAGLVHFDGGRVRPDQSRKLLEERRFPAAARTDIWSSTRRHGGIAIERTIAEIVTTITNSRIVYPSRLDFRMSQCRGAGALEPYRRAASIAFSRDPSCATPSYSQRPFF